MHRPADAADLVGISGHPGVDRLLPALAAGQHVGAEPSHRRTKMVARPIESGFPDPVYDADWVDLDTERRAHRRRSHDGL